MNDRIFDKARLKEQLNEVRRECQVAKGTYLIIERYRGYAAMATSSLIFLAAYRVFVRCGTSTYEDLLGAILFGVRYPLPSSAKISARYDYLQERLKRIGLDFESETYETLRDEIEKMYACKLKLDENASRAYDSITAWNAR